MGFLRDPKQGSALVDLVSVLGTTGLLDRQARRKLHQTTGLGAEAIIGQLSNHLTVGNLGTGLGIEAVTSAVLALQMPDLTTVGTGGNQLAVLERDAGGNDLPH